MPQALSRTYFQQPDTVLLARELLGCKIAVTGADGELTTGIIVETEAYAGIKDKACHSYNARRTNRTQTMYAPGGVAYVYLCYGIHHLLNIVTGKEDEPEAVLIRALEPVSGIDVMLRRRGMKQLSNRVTAGPGCLTQALGIDRSYDGFPVDVPPIVIYPPGESQTAQASDRKEISSGSRVGVAYAGKDALLPWRFWLSGNPYVSKAKGVQPSDLRATDK